MSNTAILHALKRGPMATSQLLKFTGSCSADVSRTCSGLIADGRIKRIDGRSGRGTRAIYALVDSDAPIRDEIPKVRRSHTVGVAAPVVSEARYVQRDPCGFCGVRADIGCRHRVAA